MPIALSVVWDCVSGGAKLTQLTLLGVLELEVLVLELGSVDRLAASTIVVGEVTSLNHEILDDTVETASLTISSAQAPKMPCVPELREA